MSDFVFAYERLTVLMVWTGVVLAASTLGAVLVERATYAYQVVRDARLARRYEPLVRQALAGDAAARRALMASPRRHPSTVARLLVLPLIDDRDPARIGRTRSLVRELSLVPRADRLLRSRWWWRRAVGLRAVGLLQLRNRTAQIVAALDDPNPDVRAAALDSLADMQDPASLQAVVVRMHDASLQRSRRAVALASFGSQCEPFLRELSHVDPGHRVNYARALALCGTALSRTDLCRWVRDERPAVRAAAFEALGHIGLDDRSAPLAIEALESRDVHVRQMAAHALRGWTGPGDAAAHLADHLDDTWVVAVEAAQALQSMPDAGISQLQANAPRADLAGLLARQMLWEARRPC